MSGALSMATRYRLFAEELRAIADYAGSEAVAKNMRCIAHDYDRLARSSEATRSIVKVIPLRKP